MLHTRKHPHNVKKAYTCAAVAKMEGINFYYFSPQGVRFNEQIIHGYIYENGKWIKKEMKFPDVIYNAGGMKTIAQKKIYRQLKKNIPITSYPVGNKLQVYNKIKKLPEFAHYLIPSVKINKPQNVFEALEKYNKVIVKPLAGNQGKGVLFIEHQSDCYKLIDGTKHLTLSDTDLHAKINDLIRTRTFLVQPFILCRTQDELPYDFRLHVQKRGTGKWGITLIYPRIGSKKGVVSNVSRGGYTGKMETFLQKEFGSESYDLMRILEHFTIRFTNRFDELYDGKLDELGIDVGIDENKKLWIFEVNWRPGQGHRHFDSAKNTIPYAAFLAKQQSPRK